MHKIPTGCLADITVFKASL